MLKQDIKKVAIPEYDISHWLENWTKKFSFELNSYKVINQIYSELDPMQDYTSWI